MIHTHIIARLVLMKNLQYNHSPGALQILLKGQGQSDYPTAQAAPGLGLERKKSKSQTKQHFPKWSGCLPYHITPLLVQTEPEFTGGLRESETRLLVEKEVTEFGNRLGY